MSDITDAVSTGIGLGVGLGTTKMVWDKFGKLGTSRPRRRKSRKRRRR